MESFPFGFCSTELLSLFPKKNGFSDDFLRELEEDGSTAVMERGTAQDLILSLDESGSVGAPRISSTAAPAKLPAAPVIFLSPFTCPDPVSDPTAPRLRFVGAPDLSPSTSKNASALWPPPRRVELTPVTGDAPVKPRVEFETAKNTLARYDDIAKHFPSFEYSMSKELTVSGHTWTGALDRAGSRVLPNFCQPMLPEEEPTGEPLEAERQAKKAMFSSNLVLAVDASPEIRKCLEDIIGSKMAKEKYFKKFETRSFRKSIILELC